MYFATYPASFHRSIQRHCCSISTTTIVPLSSMFLYCIVLPIITIIPSPLMFIYHIIYHRSATTTPD